MQNPKEKLVELFSNSLKKSFPEGAPVPLEVVKSSFGHYQFNSAMRLAKPLGKPPRAIAEALVEGIQKDSVIETLEIAGPGFINITVSAPYLSQIVDFIAHEGLREAKRPEKVVIDFSSPNIAKELHVGHLRSTIIGDSLARLLEFQGFDVLRLNHMGDWGTQFGMLIAYIKEKGILDLSKYTLSDLMSWYKASKMQFDADPEFKTRSQLEVGRLQGGDPESLRVWNAIVDISKKSYQEIYRLLDIKITDRPESFYNPLLKPIVEELKAKGITVESEGALCIFLDGFTGREGEALPLIIQKSDGAYNYATTDLAAIRHRLQEEKADRLIYVTDAGQANHFKMIFQAAEKAGWLNLKKTRVDHVPFGLVLGMDGKKFKTRSGETEKLLDLIETAISKAREIIDERQPEIDDEEKKALAETLGVACIKYADLSCHRVGDYTFSYDRMLKFEGNTASYLLYSYVRIQGIKRKIGDKADTIIKNSKADLRHPSEIALGLHLARFYETLDQVREDLLPNHLTEYLYELAEKFNAFFRDCRVEGSDEEASRLVLVEASRKVLEAGLSILGIKTVSKM